MRFYELRNFVRNKSYKLYDDAKVAALNDMYERGYVTSFEVDNGVLYAMVDQWNGDYDDGISVKEFLDTFQRLDSENFDGDVMIAESGDFGLTYPIAKPKVSDEDYALVFRPGD